MWLRGLELSSFRNYAGQAVAFGDGVNVVYGLNGQGKTNLLEGAYYCSTCKSHRTSRDADLIMGGGESFSLRAATESRFGGKSVGIRYDKGSARQVTVNGNKVAKASQVMGSVCSVLFSPEDTQMLRQGPSARRRFLDVTLCQVRPAYLSGLQAYGRALRQKNAYLSGGMGDRGVIGAFNAQLAKAGAHITLCRLEALAMYGEMARAFHDRLSSGREALGVRYAPNISVGAGRDAAPEEGRMAAAFAETLSSVMGEEMRRGASLVGPQRDDFTLTLDGEDIRSRGSQGQQRTSVLAMKLSEALIMERYLGESPILLLDDVMSELDSERRSTLEEAVGGMQVIMTCTDRPGRGGGAMHGARLYRVDRGKVFEEA